MIAKVKEWILHSPLLYRRFNNVLSPRINLRYRRYAGRCRRLPQPPLPPRGGTELAVKVRGVDRVEGVLSRESSGRISRQISRMMEEERGLVRYPGVSNLFTRIEHPLTDLGMDLLEIFHHPELDSGIRAYFGCHYRVQWLECYRSFPSRQVTSSWLWHSDNVPVETLKIMLLLTDTTAARGATEFMSRDHTMLYREKGYFGHRSSERLADLEPFSRDNRLPYDPFVIEASAGDVLVFDNNCLHRAVPPREAFRDAVTYLLLPSPVPWDQDMQRRGIAALEDKPGGYPLFPEAT